MLKKKIKIHHIPAIVWGEPSDKIIIAVHGDQSNKSDKPIELLATLAIPNGYQVLSFDLPEHGERKNDDILCKVQNCTKELSLVMQYAKENAKHISLFANSIGAYFSLMTYQKDNLDRALLLSPVVNMDRIITNMMTWFDVTPERLKAEQTISTPINKTLYWDYYSFVKENPILQWDTPTYILYGSEDEVCEFDTISTFSNTFNCSLTIIEGCKHYFHTTEQMDKLSNWLKKNL